MPANSFVTVKTGHTGTDYFRYYGPGDVRNGAGVAQLEAMPWWGDADLAQQWADNSNYVSPSLNLDGDIGGNLEEVGFVYAFGGYRPSGTTEWSTKRKADDWNVDDVTQHWSGGFAVATTTLSGITINQTGTTDGSDLLTTETGNSSTFTVVLDSAPTADVTVSITGLATREGSLSSDTLTFTAGNWNTAQTVTVSGEDDDYDDGDRSYTLIATASNTGGYAGTEAAATTVKNTDDDTNGVTIAQTGTTDGSGNLLTTEAGDSSTFSVILDAKPSANVTVSLTGNDATENSLDTSSLTFTTANWNTPQTITVTGVDDDIIDGDITTTLTATASNTGNYAGNESDTTTVKNTDDDDTDDGSGSGSGSGNNNTDQTPSSLSELISNIDGSGFRVTETSGVWVQLQVLEANADWQNSLQIVNADGDNLGSIGATKNSTNKGNNEIFISGGSEIRFHQSSHNQKLNQSPSLQINPDIDSSFLLHLEDNKSQDQDYDDLSIKITTARQSKNINAFKLASEQRHMHDPILNLTDLQPGSTKLRLTLNSDSDDASRVAFVKLTADDVSGFTVDGIASTDGRAFEQAVRDSLINPDNTEILMHGDKTRTVEWTLDQNDGGFYAPVFINQETNNLITYGMANILKGEHYIKNLGSNFFGYEDTFSAQDSDWDFNDITMLVEMV